MKRQIALLAAGGEIENVKVIDEIYKTLEYSKRVTKEELKVVDEIYDTPQYSRRVIKEYFKLAYEEETFHSRLSATNPLSATKPHVNDDLNQAMRYYSKSALNPSAQPWVPEPPMNAVNSGDFAGSFKLQQLSRQQQVAMPLMAFSIQRGFEMPKRELITLDGNPLNYWLFIKNFEVNITKRVVDGESRLTYLIQHCTGKAREAIKNCSIISEPEKPRRFCYTDLASNISSRMRTSQR